MGHPTNLQDMFLNQVRKEGIPVTIYLLGGVRISGVVRGFDAFTILLESPGKPLELVYKHAVCAILPQRQPGEGKAAVEAQGPAASDEKL
ncbi:MAG: RNA chaperone Hfq [Armatimonadota bacterium]